MNLRYVCDSIFPLNLIPFTRARALVIVSTLFAMSVSSQALARRGEAPKSIQSSLAKTATAELTLTAIDAQALRRSDEKAVSGRKPLRVAMPTAVQIGLESHGSWSKVAGGHVWRQRVIVPGATDLSFRFSEYELPEKASVHILGAHERYYEGPYTHKDRSSHGQLATPVVPGDRATIELFVTSRDDTVTLEVDRILVGYRDLFARDGGPFLQKSGSCNINVVCPVGNPWRDEIRSTGMYISELGDICTGSLIATADGSNTPYFITANHCSESEPNPANTVVYWNFESAICNVPGGGTLSQNQIGMIFRASEVISDFRLFELVAVPAEEFNAFHMGWDRSGVAANAAVSIHHPNTNDKAISFENNTIVSGPDCSIGATTPPDSHWHVIWENGTTEPGSSGASLFDAGNNKFIGVLSGGQAACGNQLEDCYGKFSGFWDGPDPSERARDWLDPTNTGMTVADGFNVSRRIEFDSYTGVDTCLSDPGNDNGFWEPGETIDVLVKIVGNDNFSGVTGFLSTTTPGVTVVTSTVNYPNLTTGIARNSITPFEIKLSPTAGPVCFSDLDFQVDVSSNESDPFVLNFDAPVGQNRDPIVPWGIPDDSSDGTTNSIQVAEDITITDMNVRVAIDHEWVGDLILILTSPAGTQVVLMDRPGLPIVNSGFGCDDDNLDIIFDDSGTINLETLCLGTDPWYQGVAPPASPLSDLNGESTQGPWTLTAIDAAFEQPGVITDWELISTPALPLTCNTCAAVEILPGAVDTLADLNGNNAPETVGFQVDEVGNITARVGDASTGGILQDITFLSPAWEAQGGFTAPPLPGGGIAATGNESLVAVVATRESDDLPIIQIRNGNNGAVAANLFPWSTAWELEDWGVVPGQAPGGEDAIGTLAVRKSDGLMGVELRDPATNTRLSIIYPLGLGWTPIAGETLDINGTVAIAVLAVRDADGLTIIQVRNAGDGSLISNIFPLGLGWSPTGEIKIVPDLNGNGAEEIATRMTRDTSGLEIIQIRDGLTNALVSNVYPIGAGGGGWNTQEFEVVDLNGVTYLAILSTSVAAEQILVQTKNALDSTIDRNIFFLAPPWTYQDYTVMDDFNASNGSELAVFVENTATGVRLIQIRDASDGSVIRNIFQ